jgi:ParB-like chromosome segregation protein Spo0J
MQVVSRKIEKLKPHPKNPRVHPGVHPESAVEKPAKSIQEYGWKNPVLVSSDGIILAGQSKELVFDQK